MAQGRFLSISVAEDERLNGLSVDAQMMYLMTIPHLDRDGLINGNPSALRGRVCPLRENFVSKMPSIINEWVESGLVVRYSTADGVAIWFKGFAKNNPLTHYGREKASKFPPPPGYTRDAKGLVCCALPDTSGILPDISGNSPREVEDQVEDQVEEKQQPPAARGGVKTESNPAIGAVFTCWADNIPGTLTPIITGMIDDWINEYGPDEVIRAIGVAVKGNKRNANYVNGILRNRAAGIDPKTKAIQDSYDSPRKRMKVLS